MRLAIRVLALTAIGAAAFAPAAHAQDMTTATFNGTTIWVGGGFQYLSLPDIKFTGKGKSTAAAIDFHRQKNSDFSDYGGAAGGGIETALGFWGGYRVTGGVKGFWSNVDTDDRPTCRRADCIVFDPTGEAFASGRRSVNQNESRCRLLGRPGELKFGRRSRSRRSRISTATTISSSAPTFAASTRTTAFTASSTAIDLQLQGDPRYHLCRRLCRLRRRIQLRLHPAKSRRPLRSPRLAHLRQCARRPLFRPHRL